MKFTQIFFISSVFSLLVSLSLPAFSANMTGIHSADSLYAAGEYKKAAEGYLSVIDNEGASAALYFNLANSYAQTGDYGQAILFYSRASRIDPSNDEIRNNLEYFVSKVEDSNRAELKGKKISVAPDPETFFTTAHRLIAEDVNSDSWAFLSVTCFILCLAGVAVYLFCGSVILRKTGFFGGICLFLLSVIFMVFAFMSAGNFDSKNQGVLIAYKMELKVEPSDDANASSNLLCQGTVFEILAEESDVAGTPTWYKVRLNADVEGWIKADDLEII